MHLRSIYEKGDFAVSIEVFPPKTPSGDKNLFQTLNKLSAYEPSFISCTYGAGGSTRTRTLDLCIQIQNTYKIPTTAHFTCVSATQQELSSWLKHAKDNGIDNIMALRGDPPKGENSFQPIEGGLRYANELVSLIKDNYPNLGIGVAGYPEKHPEAESSEVDLTNLKRKVEAGADAVFTQVFYINEKFLNFRDSFHKAGIQVPLIPGIMPITDFENIKRISSMCGTEFPEKLGAQLEKVKDDKQAQFEIGVEHAIHQCQELTEQGVPGIHFFVLNRSKACESILNALGMKPKKILFA